MSDYTFATKALHLVRLEQEERVISPFTATWEAANLGVGGIENVQERVSE